MESLKKTIMVSTDFCKRFPKSVSKKKSLELQSGLLWQAIANLCVWHLHGSKQCCFRNSAGSKLSSEATVSRGRAPWSWGALPTGVVVHPLPGSTELSRESKWLKSRSFWAGNSLKLQRRRENEQIFRQCCRSSLIIASVAPSNYGISWLVINITSRTTSFARRYNIKQGRQEYLVLPRKLVDQKLQWCEITPVPVSTVCPGPQLWGSPAGPSKGVNLEGSCPSWRTLAGTGQYLTLRKSAWCRELSVSDFPLNL